MIKLSLFKVKLFYQLIYTLLLIININWSNFYFFLNITLKRKVIKYDILFSDLTFATNYARPGGNKCGINVFRNIFLK